MTSLAHHMRSLRGVVSGMQRAQRGRRVVMDVVADDDLRLRSHVRPRRTGDAAREGKGDHRQRDDAERTAHVAG